MDLSDGWAVDKRGPDCGKPIVNQMIIAFAIRTT
jgi:hypothetical protein